MMKRSSIQIFLILAVISLVLAIPGSNLAQEGSAAEPQWWQILPPDQPGFPVPLVGAPLLWGSSPTLADLDGNGTLEIILGGRDLDASGQPGCGGWVYVYRHDGSLVWQTHVRAPVNSTPTAADLNGDGTLDVVAGLGGTTDGSQCWHGGVIALDGRNGQELWTFDTQDWLDHVHDGWLDGVFSTPAIGDVNADGQPEIAFGAWDQCIYLLDRNGQPLWGNLPGIVPGIYCGGHGFYNEDTIWSSPALADITGDGRLEIIIGADISDGNWWGDPTGGYLRILDAEGNSLAREWMDQALYSSPAVGDLDGDGDYEIVIGTGTYLSEEKGYYVSAFDYDPNPSDPADRLVLKWRAGTAGRVFASPALADLDGDGLLDVVISSLIGDWGSDGSLIYAWRGYDGTQFFSRRNCNYVGQTGNTLSSPSVADIDGDGKPEILFSSLWEVDILNHDGTYYTDYSNPRWDGSPIHPGCARTEPPTTELTYWARYSLYASPAVGDLDGDGDAEIVIGGHNPDDPAHGMIFAWTGHPKEDWPAWPMWRHDEHHSGNAFFDLIPPTNPTSLSSPSHTVGQWSASNRVQMVWSGAADEGSGVAGYSVLWDDRPDTLPDTHIDLTAESTTSPPLADGKDHYFHLRTGDRFGNWTTDALHAGPFWIDTVAPTSVADSPVAASGPFPVTWQGYDATSGVADYTVQVSDNGGAWTTWLDQTSDTSALYQDGVVGHTYRFRTIARDEAGNVETAYTDDGDTATVMARHVISGTVYNQRERPVAGAALSTQPAALNQASSEADGSYLLGMPSDGTYDLTVSHPRFGELPPMKGITVTADLGGLDLYLPPASNRIVNGDFEETGGWQVAGPELPAPVQGKGHTGDFALRMGGELLPPLASFISSSPDKLGQTTVFTNTSTGSPPLTYLWNFGDGVTDTLESPTHVYATTGTFTVYLTATNALGSDTYTDTVDIVTATRLLQAAGTRPRATAVTLTWAISQTASISDAAVSATLSWLYRVEGVAAQGDSLTVVLDGETTSLTETLPLDRSEWTHGWLDADDLIGQRVTVTFRLQRSSAQTPLSVWLDEISLGETYPSFLYLPLIRKGP